MSSIIQRSFTGGEIAPALYARADTQKYTTGLRTMKNFFIMRHGGASNRSGTEFVCEVKDSARVGRLIPFVFNADQTYMLEFHGVDTVSNGTMRVIHNGALVTVDPLAITSIAMGATTVITKAAHGRLNGEEVIVYSEDVPDLNGRYFIVANKTTDTFEIKNKDGTALDSTGFDTYVSGGTFEKVYEVTAPYKESDLPDVQYVQSADVITLTHGSYAPVEVARLTHDSWTITSLTFAPDIAAPAGLALSTAAGTAAYYTVTCVKTESYEESYPATSLGTSTTASIPSPVTITWTANADAQEYNVYKKTNGGVFGFIGVASSNTFTDAGIPQDTSETPPITRNPFTSNYPATCAYVQQRLGFGNLQNDSEGIYLSRTGKFKNFSTSSPIKDDDAVTFKMAGRQVNEIRHLLDLGNLVILTASGEWGLGSGVISPTSISPKQYSYNGASKLMPVVVNNTALYVQARGSIVRDIGYSYQTDGYTGNDLTIFSAHLFDGYQLSDWTYQKVPHSIVWAVRDDGSVLGLTYVKEHEIVGWHRHEFSGGFVEKVSSIPEGDEDFVYFIIKRTINGVTKRYIERLSTRKIDDVIDCTFLDSFKSYDGRNTNLSHTMTLSGGSTWAYDETITLTSSTSFFKSSDVGNQIHFTLGDEVMRFTIEGYTSATVVTGRPHKTVHASMRSVALTTWTRAVDEIVGLWHLEGESVSIFADRFVVGSPNNEAYTTYTVTNGRVQLEKPYGVVHIGLPITADIETLDIDSAQGEPLIDKQKNIGKVSIMCEKSRGIWAGTAEPTGTDPLEELVELKIRQEESYDEAITLATGTVEVNTYSNWNRNGRVFIRQIEPLPLSVLAIVPTGFIPQQRG